MAKRARGEQIMSHIPPIPYPGQKTNFANALRRLAQKIPPKTRVFFPFGGSGADANIIKQTNPAVNCFWNDASNYKELLDNISFLEKIRDKICLQKLEKEKAIRLIEQILPGRGEEIINILAIRGYTTGWDFWCRKTPLEDNSNYLSRVYRVKQKYRTYNDIPLNYDLFIMDPPYSKLGRAKKTYLTIFGDFPSYFSKLTKPAICFFDKKINNCCVMADCHKLSSGQYMQGNQAFVKKYGKTL